MQATCRNDGEVLREGGLVLRGTGCGRTFDVKPTDEWDVSTDDDGNVTERHLVPICPNCGSVTVRLTAGV